MKITFDSIQDNKINQSGKINDLSKTEMRVAQNIDREDKSFGILYGKGQDIQAYAKQGKNMQEIQNQTGILSAETYQNYMVVMSSTMSGEDFASLIEDGVKPGKTEVGDAVTIMDHIKTVMAKSGVVISGFNGSGDISMETLKAMTGNDAYAESIAKAFEENDVPLTEENVAEAIKQTDLAMKINGLSDEVKQYMLENEVPLSIDQIYKANYSAQMNQRQNGNPANRMSSYFADDLNGYFGKTMEVADYTMLSDQIEKVIKEAGLTQGEETMQEASWILQKGILLTGENLEKLHQMNQMVFPVTREHALSHISQALREGKPASEADLSKDGIYKQAAAIKEAVDGISDQAVKQVINSGERINIRNLANAQKTIDLSIHQTNQMQNSFVHAQRMLQEVRLQMTISANIMLLKSNYAIETAELSDLVEQLKTVEQDMSLTQGLSLPDVESNGIFRDVMEKTTEIRQMPVAVVPRVLSISENFTLSHVHKEGRILESTYKRAGESYEALMTTPRADLGDRWKDAFSNVDDILSDLDFELTEDHRRAIRILAYNKMELTQENIIAVREADASLRTLLDKMTPSATLQMIRDGINPLEESVRDLTQYFSQQEKDLNQQTETFSHFLYQLENNDQISEQERDTYIGIYRLIHQIQKGDGKAIGTVLSNGQPLSFDNLLSAIRTGQKRGIDISIDDDFGFLKETQVKGSRISDQINHYYETKAADLLTKLNPSIMVQNDISMETTWEELMELCETEQIENALESSYRNEQLQRLRETLQVGKEVVEFLVKNGQPVTPDNLEAADKLLHQKGEMFRKLRDAFSIKKENRMHADEIAEDADIIQELENLTEQFTDMDSAQESYAEMYQKMSEELEETMLSGNLEYLDIRALSALSKQLSLAKSLTKEEHYELPAVIDGQLTSVNVRFRHEQKTDLQKGAVSIQIQLTDGNKIMAELKVNGDMLSGFVGCTNREKAEVLRRKQDEFVQNILSETGKMADINIVYSQDVNMNYFENDRQAGKPANRFRDDSKKTYNQTEEVQGRHTSAKELYQAAKAFIALLKE